MIQFEEAAMRRFDSALDDPERVQVRFERAREFLGLIDVGACVRKWEGFLVLRYWERDWGCYFLFEWKKCLGRIV